MGWRRWHSESHYSKVRVQWVYKNQILPISLIKEFMVGQMSSIVLNLEEKPLILGHHIIGSCCVQWVTISEYPIYDALGHFPLKCIEIRVLWTVAQHVYVGLHLKPARNQLLEIHHELSWETFYTDFPGQYAGLKIGSYWPDVCTSQPQLLKLITNSWRGRGF